MKPNDKRLNWRKNLIKNQLTIKRIKIKSNMKNKLKYTIVIFQWKEREKRK
jgi:hypothetical protein